MLGIGADGPLGPRPTATGSTDRGVTRRAESGAGGIRVEPSTAEGPRPGPASSDGPPIDRRPAGIPDEGRIGGIADDEIDAWTILASTPGVGPVSFARLVERFGSARAALLAAIRPDGPATLIAATAAPDGGRSTLAPGAARAIGQALASGDRLLRSLRRAGVRPVPLVDPAYPSRLRRVELPPPVLFILGEAAALERACPIAVVGTRRPSVAGRDVATRIGDALAATGSTVVSGLAFGIDAAAHLAAIRAGGPTVAVIGGGHDRLTPRSHIGLARSIVATGGAIASEFPPGIEPTRGTFPRRNRIISGLADATVVVEAGLRSGALTTAAWALEQGRGLYLVPGSIDSPSVAGCLAFLRELAPEARIVAGIPELLEDLGLPGDPVGHGAPRTPGNLATPAVEGEDSMGSGPSPSVIATLGTAEASVATLVAAGASSVDELVAGTRLPPAAVLAALTVLEVRGLVATDFGRYRPSGGLRPRESLRPRERGRDGARLAPRCGPR